jgi:predicted amidohydrolase
MKIAIVSLDQVWEDKTANQLKCQNCIRQASKSGCDLIVFPEMTLTGFSMNTALIAEEPQQSPTVDFFIQQAEAYKLAVAFGVVFVSGKTATNNLVVIDQTGSKLSSYAKIHPFSFSGENNYYSGGNQLGQCEIEGTTIGLTICYDLRFPEIFQALSKDCSIILNIANWPEKRIKHWNVLLEARAIENQSFIIGVNRTGIDGYNLNYVKSSLVFNSNGERIEPVNTYLDMDIFDLNPEDATVSRKGFPIKKDRKIKFYKTIL